MILLAEPVEAAEDATLAFLRVNYFTNARPPGIPWEIPP